MLTTLGVTVIAVSTMTTIDVDPSLIARIEETPLFQSSGEAIPRIERNADGDPEVAGSGLFPGPPPRERWQQIG